MPAEAAAELGPFLERLRDRYTARRVEEPEYDAILYRTTFLPEPDVLGLIHTFLARRRGAEDRPTIPEALDTRERLAAILEPMHWPDPTPLAGLAEVLPDWDSLHLTTLMHAEIPDYPIWGPEECRGARLLGFDVDYDPAPAGAVDAYRRYMDAVKRIRDAASFEVVPECHHYLTRIVQSALFALGTEETTTDTPRGATA